MCLHNLPEEIILHITKYLNGREVVKLSHVCQNFFYILQNEHLWSTISDKENQVKEADIFSYAKIHAATTKQKLVNYHAREKFSYIFHLSIASNLKNCSYAYQNLILSDKCKVGNDGRNLVQITTTITNTKKRNWSITVYDLRHHGFHAVTVNRPLNIDLREEHEIFNLDLCAILVARYTAVLCFKGTGDDTPQEMIAIDLTPGCDYQELWRDVIHDWGQFQLSRLFGREVYKFDLLNNSIETHDIRTYDKLSTLQLVEEMRYPHGEISGDGRHLAIPGKMSNDNSPAVCVWNVRKRSRKFLYPTIACCPFRWFEKVAVSKGKVYGLLNRRCLFAWDAESGNVLFKIDLTESYPGQNQEQPTFTYLSVFNNYLATINTNPSCQIVYQVGATEEEPSLKLVLPQLNINWLKDAMGGKAEVRVCDVKMNDHCIIIQMLNLTTHRFEALLIRMDRLDASTVNSVGKCCIILNSAGLQIPGQLILTPTKLLNLTPNQMCMYDFLM